MPKPKPSLLLTGASGQLGQAFARDSLGHYSHVFATDILDLPLNLGITFSRCELSELNVNSKLVEDFFASTDGGLHVVNFAGRISNSPILHIRDGRRVQVDWADWLEILTDNVYPVIKFSASIALKAMTAGRELSIVQVSSINSHGLAGQSAYSAGKAALEAASRSLAYEFGPLGIRINTLRLGHFETSSTFDNIPKPKLDSIIAATSLRKLGQTEELAPVILSTLTSTFMNGSIIDLDGGRPRT